MNPNYMNPHTRQELFRQELNSFQNQQNRNSNKINPAKNPARNPRRSKSEPFYREITNNDITNALNYLKELNEISGEREKAQREREKAQRERETQRLRINLYNPLLYDFNAAIKMSRNATKASTSSTKRRHNKLNTNKNVQRETQRERETQSLRNNLYNPLLYDFNAAIKMSRNATKASTSSTKRRHNKLNTNRNVPSGYKLHDVAGDGDCLYHAVYEALKKHEGLKDHRHHRRLLNTLKNTSDFREELADFIENESNNKNTRNARAAVRRIRSGGWGQEYEVIKIIDMIKHKFKINLCIKMYNAKDEINYGENFRWQLFTPGLTNPCMYVILLHNSGNTPGSEHFQFMTD